MHLSLEEICTPGDFSHEEIKETKELKEIFVFEPFYFFRMAFETNVVGEGL